MASSLAYNPLGTDSVAFACHDVRFWEGILARFGFERVSSASRRAQREGLVAMAHGGLRALLVDPKNKEHGAQVGKFLADHGNMQVFSASILVDDAAKAREELSRVVGCSPVQTVEDPLGTTKGFRLRLHLDSASTWEVVERVEDKAQPPSPEPWRSLGVDHFAIAVRKLQEWVELYQSIGFETIYIPKDEIVGDHSGMRTAALQRGSWVVALVEGVDKELPSQVSTYWKTHGDHAIQHAAIRFRDLRSTLQELMGRGAQFRVRRVRPDPGAPLVIEDIMHEGRDHSGPLLQCFTKPLARRGDPKDPRSTQAGFFFELIQRVAAPARGAEAQAFHDPTVIGLYRSIEQEELAKDSGLIFADMERYPFLAAPEGVPKS